MTARLILLTKRKPDDGRRKRYRERHPDRVKASNDTFYEKNRDQVLAKVAAWRESHMMEKRVYQRTWKRMKALRAKAAT